MVDPEAEYEKLDRYCYYRVGSRETAEDLTQEAFTRFWEKGGHGSTMCEIAKAVLDVYFADTEAEIITGENALG